MNPCSLQGLQYMHRNSKQKKTSDAKCCKLCKTKTLAIEEGEQGEKLISLSRIGITSCQETTCLKKYQFRRRLAYIFSSCYLFAVFYDLALLSVTSCDIELTECICTCNAPVEHVLTVQQRRNVVYVVIQTTTVA